MQKLVDVLNMPVKIATTEQTCAFGAAMFEQLFKLYTQMSKMLKKQWGMDLRKRKCLILNLLVFMIKFLRNINCLVPLSNQIINFIIHKYRISEL